MRAKFIFEDIGNVLKPKSKSEIISTFNKSGMVDDCYDLVLHSNIYNIDSEVNLHKDTWGRMYYGFDFHTTDGIKRYRLEGGEDEKGNDYVILIDKSNPETYSFDIDSVEQFIFQMHLYDEIKESKNDMKAKKVYEAIGDVLKPKSQKEIDQGLEKIEMNKALDLAYRNNNFPMILKLLRKGAEFESLNSYYGSEDGNKKFIQTNRDKFFDDNPDKKFLNNLLKKASQIDFPDMAKWALDNGADIQFADGRGNTPLYYAAKYQSPNTLKLLVKRDADLNYQNKDGVTPILASITPSGKHPDPDTLFEIIEDVVRELELKVMNGEPVSFAKTSKSWAVFDANYNISQIFKEYYNNFGAGYYLMSVGVKNGNIPGKHIFPDRNIGTGVVQYIIPLDSLDLFLKELVSMTFSGMMGTAFHLQYFPEKVKESLSDIFKPKSKEEIVDSYLKDALKNINKSIGIYWHLGSFTIHTPIGRSLWNKVEKEFGPGIYFNGHFNNFEIEKLMRDLNIPYEKILKGTYKLPNLEISDKTKFLTLIIYEALEDKDLHFVFKEIN